MAQHEPSPSARRRSQALPKHSIFLSHSGNEKPFVEQLCEDLKGMNHDPFFDQDSYSLEKAEKFAPLIFSAAEQCLLAVVVLSKGYLSSKWPMLELSTFVKSMKGENPSLKLYPVFYKLSPSDLSAEKVETHWRASWEKLVQEGKVSAEEIASWSDAVRELRAFNGMEFSKYGTSEVKFRAALVVEMCNKVPPIMKYKTDNIRGYERLCKVTSGMLQEQTYEDTPCREGCYYLGLHGLGGVGKSTLCTAMCSYIQEVYRMKVCHVELPSNPEEESPSAAEMGRITRLKFVIQELANFSTRIIDRIVAESQGLKLLEEQLQSQPPVFLAVDNVGDSESSRDEARGLLKTILAPGSKVMVTSRSRMILKSIFHTDKYSKPLPRLEAHEARELFLSVAARKKLLLPLQPCEVKIVEACLGECQFGEDGHGRPQYHPLTLRAVGSYFYDVDDEEIMEWKNHLSLKLKDKVQGSREFKRVNNILGLNYSSLSSSSKLMFLDMALLWNHRMISHIMGPLESLMGYRWPLSFIATLHGLSRVEAEMKVKELQRRSLIYETSHTLEMHDLYIEFAKSLVMKEGNIEREWWVLRKNWVVGMNFETAKRLYLDRTEIFPSTIDQLERYDKLECLVLTYTTVRASENLTFDVRHLRSLRVLIVRNVRELQKIVCNCEGEGNDLPELEIVLLRGLAIQHIPFITHCHNLRSLKLDVGRNVCDTGDFKIFQKLKALETLCFRCTTDDDEKMHVEELLKIVTSLPFLRVLEINFPHEDIPLPRRFWKLDVGLLGSLPFLSTLSLFLRASEVQGLDHLQGLTVLKLSCLWVLRCEDISRLSSLTTLNLRGCKLLRELPNLEVLPYLREVCIAGCPFEEDKMYRLKKYQPIRHHKSHKSYKCQWHRMKNRQ